MLGVPAKIKTPDLLQFTAPCQPDLDMIRIITDGSSPNQFMVLLRFRCQVCVAVILSVPEKNNSILNLILLT